MFKKIITIVFLGVMMATLMSVILGCEDIDSKTANAIQDRLAKKYGESFTVASLGNRIGYDTVTAYVYADNDPSMRFTAKLDKNLKLVFDDYGYRSVCRRTQNIVESAFSDEGLEICAYCEYEYLDNSLGLTAAPSAYIEATSSSYVAIAMIVKDHDEVSGERILRSLEVLHKEFGDVLIGIDIFVVSAEDYSAVYDKVLQDTTFFDAARLTRLGAEGQIREVTLQYTAEGATMTEEQIDAALAKGAE